MLMVYFNGFLTVHHSVDLNILLMDRPEFVLYRDTWRVRVNTAMKMRGSIKRRISLPAERLIAYKLCYTELAIIQIYLF
jgi:hypothetical protein